ncbi:hydroxysqualene dehydroxylase HpnE [Bacteroidota bacterium]
MKKTVTIIGGGIAGLSAAVFLTEKKFDVKLIESSPKLGGRAYSYYDKEKDRYFDNGQHILAGWYKNTFEYLKIIGTYDKLSFQKALEINFIDKRRKVYKLKCPRVFAPLNIILGLWRYNGFTFYDKIKLMNVLRLINKEKFPDKMLHEITVKDLLSELDQSDRSSKLFWNSFIYAVFNATPENVNAFIFVNVLKIGFTKINYSNLVIPNINLNNLLINDALKYLKNNDVEIQFGKAVSKIKINNNRVEYLEIENEGIINSDFYVCAVPFFSFKNIFDTDSFDKYFVDSDMLRPSSIISIHLFFEDEIPENVLENNSFGMTGLIDTNVQWIFKRSPNHLSLVISGADFMHSVFEKSREEIVEMCIEELNECIVGFKELKIIDSKVIKEQRATFIPDIQSVNYRCEQVTGVENLFVAGDWTDTKLPSTLESAVKSSKIISEFISKNKSKRNR